MNFFAASVTAPLKKSVLSEKATCLLLGLFTIVLTCVPYSMTQRAAPAGTHFIGTEYNIPDYCVYMSWMRQASEGHFFLRDLFTTSPQNGGEFNLFFWSLGELALLTHFSQQMLMQSARVVGGVGLLFLIYRFYQFLQPSDPTSRLAAFGFVCLSSGFGWLTWKNWDNGTYTDRPIDTWLPEANTFLSLYTSPLFTVSTLLIVATFYALLLAEHTGRWKYCTIAGLCGAVLGNIHSFDVVHIVSVWGLFLVVWTFLRRGSGVRPMWGRAVYVFSLMLPTTYYQYHIFRTDPVLQIRAATQTLSPSLSYYIAGYGIVFTLALAAVVWTIGLWMKRISSHSSNKLTPSNTSELSKKMLFMVCWSIAGLIAVYIPLDFQRRFIMGEHIPLCFLAGIALSLFTEQLSILPRALSVLAVVVVSAPSNILFLARDITDLYRNTSVSGQSPYINNNLLDAYDWLQHNTPEQAAVVSFPTLCTFLPGRTGHPVWAGHWSETPNYAKKVEEFNYFAYESAATPIGASFLRKTNARYLLYPKNLKIVGRRFPYVDLAIKPPDYLTSVYENKQFVVFYIHDAAGRTSNTRVLLPK